MKLLIYHSNPEIYLRLALRPGAADHVVIPCHQLSQLLPLVLQTEPHLVLLGGGLDRPTELLVAGLEQLGVPARIRQLPEVLPDDAGLDAIWSELAALHRSYSALNFDRQYYTLLAAPTCGLPESKTREVEDRGCQTDRLLALLETGRKHHSQARAYHHAARRTQRAFESDWTLGTLLGGPASLFWRTQLTRHVGTLAHYVPGVDVACLPLPHPPSRRLDSVTAGVSVEAAYGLKAVCAFGLAAEFAKRLKTVVAVDGVTQPHTLPGVVELAGWARLLCNLASAHVWVLERALAPDPERWRLPQSNHHTRNQQRLFCHAWGLSAYANAPDALPELIRAFHAGRRARVRRFVSFREFIRPLQAAELMAGN